ncbi:MULTISPECIES: sulfate permease [Arsenicicoccus]|uniref:sulfate permease n=1 Tax=Arsenicicoccus TaxID=267408 RepID=UPI00258032C7|nr:MULTISPECIES: sulfate permease [Arsenicicoccus]
MFRLIWTLSVHTRDYLHRYMPSNRLLTAIRTRRGLKWGIPAMLIALPYLLMASICSGAAADGGPGWLHLIVLWACWNALKFIIMGPVSVALLIRARLRETANRRDQRREAVAEADTRVPVLRS